MSTATILSYHSFVRAVLRDTLRGESTMRGMAERRTALAASGSTQKLNSALGVMFPAPSGSVATAPPMITISLIRSASPGACRRAMATLVRGPMASRLTSPGRAITVLTMKSTALSRSGFFRANPPGGGAGGSSDHQRPWTRVAKSLFSWSSGMSAPL